MDVKEVKMQKGCKDVKRCKMMFKTSLQPFTSLLQPLANLFLFDHRTWL